MSAKRIACILWGLKLDVADSPIKLCEYCKAAFNSRKREGWALEVCDEGESPVHLVTLSAKSSI